MAFFNKRYHPAGTAPGTLTRARPLETAPVLIRLMDYDAEAIAVREGISALECKPFLESKTVTWVHVQGQPSEGELRELGAAFKLHALALEDVLNIGQRPKVDAFADQLFVIMSLPLMVNGDIEVHQVSLFLGDTWIISFCEADFLPFQPIVNRLQVSTSRLRGHGADYLLHALLDAIVDQAFPVLEQFGQQLEEAEAQILEDPDHGTLSTIHMIKRELILLRRSVWPQREVINHLLRDDDDRIHPDTLLYFRDCYDHTIQIMDILEMYRDMASSLLDIYLSSQSNRMNSVMRVLTIIATIFIPLTFVVGVYGMNFDRSAGPWSMPELGHPLGYVFVWLAMIVIAGGMVLFFRSRKWF